MLEGEAKPFSFNIAFMTLAVLHTRTHLINVASGLDSN